jgi:type IV pilus assembly protein PilA
MRKRFWKGLRAIEIGIVLIVISIILSVVAARMPTFKCRAMQSEAKFCLQEIFAAQQYYHAQHDQYAPIERLQGSDGRINLPQKYYQFKDQTAPAKDSFSIAAVGIDGTLVSGEVWMVDQDKNITLVKEACKR